MPQGPKDKAEKAAKVKAAKARLEDGSIGTQRQWPADCIKGDDGKYAGNRGAYLKQIRRGRRRSRRRQGQRLRAPRRSHQGRR